jgi:drug/metabolite transporter (DMT)-like permease
VWPEKGSMSEPKPIKKFLMVMGLALGLPSTIVGLFFLLHQLVKSGHISWNVLLIILISVIAYFLFLMVRNVLAKKDKQ